MMNLCKGGRQFMFSEKVVCVLCRIELEGKKFLHIPETSIHIHYHTISLNFIPDVSTSDSHNAQIAHVLYKTTAAVGYTVFTNSVMYAHIAACHMIDYCNLALNYTGISASITS